MISCRGIGRFSAWGRAFAVFVLPLVVAATAHAQWTVVNLHPAGATHSYALSVGGGQQAGVIRVGGSAYASLWSGTAASWVDLHTFLPSNFTSSHAFGIWNDGLRTYVVGNGWNEAIGRSEALMWVVPEPASLFALGAGLSLLGFRRRRVRVDGVRP